MSLKFLTPFVIVVVALTILALLNHLTFAIGVH